jgi:hypothetical protein
VTRLILDYSREEAKKVVKVGFEREDSIKKYHDYGNRIVGATPAGLASFGSEVQVQIPRDQEEPDETRVWVKGEPRLETNIFAQPTKYKSQFIDTLRRIRAEENAPELMKRHRRNTKEVQKAKKMGSGAESFLIVFFAVLLLTYLFLLL